MPNQFGLLRSSRIGILDYFHKVVGLWKSYLSTLLCEEFCVNKMIKQE